MGFKKAYDLAVVTEFYVGNDGQEKKKYQNIGIAMQSDKGLFLLIDRSFNPAGIPFDATKGNRIMVSMFEPRDGNGNAPRQQGAGKSAAGNADEDIPF